MSKQIYPKPNSYALCISNRRNSHPTFGKLGSVWPCTLVELDISYKANLDLYTQLTIIIFTQLEFYLKRPYHKNLVKLN